MQPDAHAGNQPEGSGDGNNAQPQEAAVRQLLAQRCSQIDRLRMTLQHLTGDLPVEGVIGHSLGNTGGTKRLQRCGGGFRVSVQLAEQGAGERGGGGLITQQQPGRGRLLRRRQHERAAQIQIPLHETIGGCSTALGKGVGQFGEGMATDQRPLQQAVGRRSGAAELL